MFVMTTLYLHIICSDSLNIVCGKQTEGEIVLISGLNDYDKVTQNEAYVKSLIECSMFCKTTKCRSFSFLPDTGTCRTFGERFCILKDTNNGSTASQYYIIDDNSSKFGTFKKFILLNTKHLLNLSLLVLILFL